MSDTSLRPTLLRLLGPGLAEALVDPDVTEIYVVEGEPQAWVDSRSQGRYRSDWLLPAERVEMLLNAVATSIGVDFGARQPMLAAELPDGLGRLQGFRPPVAAQPFFVLRKPAPAVIPLDDLVAQGFLPEHVAHRLRTGLTLHETILVVGGTGTGKTTFLNSLLAELPVVCSDERVGLLEDTPELVCSSPDFFRLRTMPGVSLYDLLDASLRSSPHRIVVGEVRDHSALAMLDAWNTGHPGGLATLHANGCEEALIRLGNLVQRAQVPPQPQLIASTVSLVVHLTGTNAHRRHLAALARVRSYDARTEVWTLEFLYERTTPC